MRREPTHVYLAQRGRFTKIGVSCNPEQRVKQLPNPCRKGSKARLVVIGFARRHITGMSRFDGNAPPLRPVGSKPCSVSRSAIFGTMRLTLAGGERRSPSCVRLRT